MFRVSQSIRLHAGYTGMWMAGIARASANTGYKSSEKRVQFAQLQDPTKPASADNPWVVKTTGPGPGNEPLKPDGTPNPYYVANPQFNSIGAVNNSTQYVFTNGVDFGIEIKY